jgi:hypothetical protein
MKGEKGHLLGRNRGRGSEGWATRLSLLARVVPDPLDGFGRLTRVLGYAVYVRAYTSHVTKNFLECFGDAVQVVEAPNPED